LSRACPRQSERHFQVKTTGRRTKITVSADGSGIVSQAGGLLLARTLQLTGMDRGLSAGLARWRPPRAVHDPGKIIADLVTALALGGDCLADVAVLRAQPGLFGPVASDPVVSRLISRLADDLPAALKAIRAARASARERHGRWPEGLPREQVAGWSRWMWTPPLWPPHVALAKRAAGQ